MNVSNKLYIYIERFHVNLIQTLRKPHIDFVGLAQRSERPRLDFSYRDYLDFLVTSYRLHRRFPQTSCRHRNLSHGRVHSFCVSALGLQSCLVYSICDLPILCLFAANIMFTRKSFRGFAHHYYMFFKGKLMLLDVSRLCTKPVLQILKSPMGGEMVVR